MRKTSHLQLVVSNSTRNLYERCLLADPLLVLLGSTRLQRVLDGIGGEPPYSNFRAYWRRTSRGDCRPSGTLEEFILSAVKNYFFAQLTKAFVNAPRIWMATKLEIENSIEHNRSIIKSALLDRYPYELAEIIFIHRAAHSIVGDVAEIDT